ncbi:microsomal glutathione S-transferase 1-like [Tubulanus polymorphus]|uniref:microsomal glutathione S-transferase 1-like n=1 Tax=Tubulanus polymorphus TaxID=672921 RepID=UPI003DA226CA
MAPATLSLENPVFAAYVFYSTLCILKMLLMVPLTVRQRYTNKVFSNPEDCKGLKTRSGEKVQPVFDHDGVERVRRNHLNDIENIIPFIILAFFYLVINPDQTVAIYHFRIFLISRVLHTISYQCHIPQPARGLSFMVGMIVNFSMAIQVVMATYS